MEVDKVLQLVVSLTSTHPFPAADCPATVCYAVGVLVSKSTILAPYGFSAPMAVIARLGHGHERLVSKRHPFPSMTGASLLELDCQIDSEIDRVKMNPSALRLGSDVWVLSRDSKGITTVCKAVVAAVNQNPPEINGRPVDYNRTYFTLGLGLSQVPPGTPIFTDEMECVGFYIHSDKSGRSWAVLAHGFEQPCPWNRDLGVVWELQEAARHKGQCSTLPKQSHFLVAKRVIARCNVEEGDILEEVGGVHPLSFESYHNQLSNAGTPNKLILKRGQDQKTVEVSTIDFSGQMVSSLLNVEAAFTVTERGLLPFPRVGRHCPTKTLYVEASSDEGLVGRYIFEVNGNAVSLVSDLKVQIRSTSQQLVITSKCYCRCAEPIKTHYFNLGPGVHISVGSSTDTGLWTFESSIVSVSSNLRPSPTRFRPRKSIGEKIRVIVQCHPPSERECPTWTACDQTGYILQPGKAVVSTAVAPMKGYKTTITYNGEKADGIVDRISIFGLAMVTFDPTKLEAASPRGISKVRPGWFIWGNRAQGKNWRPAWTPRSRELVKTDIDAGCPERLLVNVVDMDIDQGEVVWADTFFTGVTAVTIERCTISAADIITLFNPESRILPVLFDTVSSSNVGPLLDWKKRGRFGVDTYLSVRAAKGGCGLDTGDIVVAANGKPVPTSLSFKSTPVRITAFRNGKEINADVETIQQSEFERLWSVSWCGLILQAVPLEQRILMDLSTGLHISNVQSGSPAASWAIPVPSYLLCINGVEVQDKNGLVEQIRGLGVHPNGEHFPAA